MPWYTRPLPAGRSTRIFPIYSTPVLGVVADAYPAATGWTYEVGAKVKMLDDQLEVDGSVFYNDIQNGVLTYLDASSARFFTTYQDYATAGFELQARAQIMYELQLIGGVGYTHSELGSGSADPRFKWRQVPNVPSCSANAAIQYETPLDALSLSEAFSAAAELQYVSSRVADVQQSFDLRPYSVVNLQSGWKNEQDHFEVYGFARNLFDKLF